MPSQQSETVYNVLEVGRTPHSLVSKLLHNRLQHTIDLGEGLRYSPILSGNARTYAILSGLKKMPLPKREGLMPFVWYH